uniref:60S ribosome biogenesis factor Nog1 n=1 Tax=Saccharomyces cerevisiae BY4741 TaxID=1247190 RepID=UPI002240E3F4|nr:Chain b, 60S ribosome biogenesis factor Nog1 [Saccharomyces cerevisiae BY4741]
IVLNRTQRKTPTVIRPGFKITRIRAFYMRKVKYTGEGMPEILDGKNVYIRNRQKTMIAEARNRKSLKNKAIMPR